MLEIPALPDEPMALGVDAATGVNIRQIDVTSATLVAGRGAVSQLSETILAGLGVILPKGPRCVTAQGISAVGIGPGHWMIVAEHGQPLLDLLQKYAGPYGSATDQSDSSVVYEMSGPRAREALEKILLIDVDPIAFPVGSTATTQAALIGITLWRPDDTPRFLIAVARSYATAFQRAISAAIRGL